MSNPLYYFGEDLFHTFDLTVESEITFADYCKDLIFSYLGAIRFTSDALLLVHPTQGQDDWLESDVITFYAWKNILSIKKIQGSVVVDEINQDKLCAWLSDLPVSEISYPRAYVREGNLAFVFEGQPRSVRSKGGKRKFREQVEALRPSILAHYPSPVGGNMEMHVDIFSNDSAEMPDVDRLSTTIMDAFQGLVYHDDKQIKHLRPRIFDSSGAYTKLECRTEPMAHFELNNIPTGSLFPLASGIENYYVVRIYPTR